MAAGGGRPAVRRGLRSALRDPPLGQLTSWGGGRLAEPQGRLHFAGSEASNLPSFMEGAVRAGERAADEMLAAE
ncbi:MAG: FAD-dependent oxidoreductase [Gaiellaceae bacterium]